MRMPTRICLGRALAGAALVTGLGAGVPALAAKGQTVTIGTAGVQGVYFPLGGAVCRMINVTRKQHGLRCSVAPSEGSVANIRGVLAGEVDMGLAQSDMQQHARVGEPPFQGAPHPKLRALFSVYPELFMVIARPDASVRAFGDLKGKRVAIGTAGSGTRATMELVMGAFGVQRSELRAAPELKFVELAPALCEAKIDAFVFVAGLRNPVIEDAAVSCGARIVPVAGPPVDALLASRPYYRKAEIPGRMYRGTNDPIPTFGTVASVIVSEDMPEGTAYAITRAVFENFDDFRKLHPALASMTKAAAVQGSAVPLHPGARRYFNEAGLI